MVELNKITRLLTDRVKDTFTAVELQVHDDNPGKEQQLLNGILEGRFKTDDEAASGMYGTDGTDQRFRMLKSRLRQRLLNMLFLVNYNDSRTKISHQYEQEALNYILKAKILLREGIEDIAEKMTNKALMISTEAEFTSITLDGLNLMRRLDSFNCKPADFFRNEEDLEKYRKLYAIEEEAMDIYFKYRMLIRKSVNSRKKNIDEAKKAADKLEELWKKTSSFNIFEKYYILKMMCYESFGEYDVILKLTEQTEKEVSKGKLNPLRFDQRYNVYMRTYAFLRTNQLNKGLKYAEGAIQHFERSTSNWFAHMENYYSIAMRKQDYDLAKDILEQVFRNPHMENLRPKMAQRWKLLRAYLYLIHPNQELQYIVNFDEFYLSFNVLKEDKNGLNVALLVLEFMHYLSRNKKEKLLDKVERLEKYLYRYLNEADVTPRDKIFFKMLLVIVDTGFNVELARKKGKKLLEKLQKTEESSDAYAEMEIIPYEHLWEHLMKMMKKELAYA
ncbi:MAG: hypothetical protein RJQ09_08195 [Cyclobacteriaceae bacterium]